MKFSEMLKKTYFVSAFLVVYLLLMSIYLYKNQYYNVDMEAYMGLVYQSEYPEMKIEDIHHKVYEELRIKRPSLFVFNETKEEITKGENTYYKILQENPKAYGEELHLFSVKPFYNFINLVFYKIGFEASTSTFLISIISYFFILLVVFSFLKQVLKNQYLALIIVLVFSLFKPLLDSSRHASPDNLSCLLLLLSFYFYVLKRNLLIFSVFAILCILTRPEYFIFYSFLAIYRLVQLKITHQKTLPTIISFFSLAVSFGVIQIFNKIPWSVLFMNQFIKVQIYPITNPDSFNIKEYFQYLKSHILLDFNSSYFPLLFLFVVIILGIFYSIKVKENLKYYCFYVLLFSSVFLRYLIFPSLVNRMMIGFYFIIILSLIYILCSQKDLSKKVPILSKEL